MTMNTVKQDLTTYYMASDMESLLQLLQGQVLESPHSAGTLQVHYYKMANGSVTWLSKSPTGALFSV